MPNPQLDTLQNDGTEPGAFDATLDDDDEDEEDEVEPELEALFALAQIDAEVAVAYEIVAEDVAAQPLHDKLLEFAREHRTQAAEIAEYLRAQGVEPAGAMPDPETAAFATLANSFSAIAPASGLRSLRASELFTHAAYSALLDLVGNTPARALVERSLEHERQHARWLERHAAELVESREEA